METLKLRFEQVIASGLSVKSPVRVAVVQPLQDPVIEIFPWL